MDAKRHPGSNGEKEEGAIKNGMKETLKSCSFLLRISVRLFRECFGRADANSISAKFVGRPHAALKIQPTVNVLWSRRDVLNMTESKL